MQMPIHQNAGADLRRLVDEQLQPFMRKCLGGGMMIEIGDAAAGFKNSFELRVIGIQRHIQHGDVNHFVEVDSPQQVDLALNAGNQYRILRLRQPELMQRA